MDIEVEVTRDQFMELAQLASEHENHYLTEEEYWEAVARLLGPSLRVHPSDGDTLHLVLKNRIQVATPGVVN